MALGRISGQKFQRKKPKRHIREYPAKFQISNNSPVPDRKVYLMGFKEDHGFRIQGNPVKEDSSGLFMHTDSSNPSCSHVTQQQIFEKILQSQLSQWV